MTAEQLQAARAAHWRQNRNPILTLEDAAEWLSRHPLTLFLPRRAQLPAPAPSLVEACIGGPDATPPHAAVEQAKNLLARLMASDSSLALNLLGLPLLGLSGEQPDFIAHREVLPFLVSLRGERDWKHAPGSSAIHKVSPLVVELWKALEQAGPLTAAGIREKLGHELTESAVLRALSELWRSLRAIPVLQPEGQPAIWELLEIHHGDAIAQGIGTSQVTAISLLVSMYLQSVYAASGEEIEVFLSPLAARSRIREAVRGLSATRQIRSLSMETQTYYFLEDGLPEFAEAEPKPASEPRLRRPPASAAPGAPAKFAPPPDRVVASPKRSGPPASRHPAAARRAAPAAHRAGPPPAADRGRSKPRPERGPDRGDFRRRSDARPAYGKRPGGGQARPERRPDSRATPRPDPRPIQREAAAGARSKRESFSPRQGERPATHKKERWRNTPGKPGYRPDRARPQGAAPPTRHPDAKNAPAAREFSRPARPPFRPTGGRPSPGTGRPVRPRGSESGPPRTGAPPRKFQDRKSQDRGSQSRGFKDREFKDRGTWQDRRTGKPQAGTRRGGTEGLAPPRRWSPAGGNARAGQPGARPSSTRPPGTGPKAGGGFPASRPGRGKPSGPAAGGRRFSGQKPGGFARGGRPSAGKSSFGGRGPRDGKDKERKKPEA